MSIYTEQEAAEIRNTVQLTIVSLSVVMEFSRSREYACSVIVENQESNKRITVKYLCFSARRVNKS